MRIKLIRTIRKPPWLKVWSTITGIALVIALVLTFLPVNVQISTSGLISIDLSSTRANPSFTARTETYFNAASLTTPFDATHNKPTGTAQNDILFTLICWYSYGGATIDSVPSGWTLLGAYLDNFDKYALYYKIAGASEPSSYTWSFSATVQVRLICSCYTGGDFDTADPIDVVSNTAYRGLDATVRAASINVASANSPLVFFAIRYALIEITFTKPSTPTTDWVEDDDAGSGTAYFWNEICSMIWSGSGATGNMDGTMSGGNQNKHAFAVALNPVSIVAPTVTTQAATSVLSTSCTGNGNIVATGGANPTTRGFCYKVGTSGDPTTADSTAYDTGSFGTGAYTKAISGLTPSTGYRVRAYAINTAGTGYGTTVQVTTLPGDPSALTDTAHAGTSIDLTWTKGTGADKTLIRYRIDQYPTGISDGTQAYFDTASTTSVGSLSYGQIYYFRAWAYNTTSALYSSGTSDRTCFTDPNAPTSFVVTQVTNSSIALSWAHGTGADKTRVQYRSDQYPTAYTDGTQAYFDTGTSVNVTSLDSGQVYYFRAWSYDTESGYYDSYAQLTETTVGIPTAITQAASDIGCTTARINGQISDDGGETCEARFRYGPIVIEEQTLMDGAWALYGGSNVRVGQKLTIPNREVMELGLWICKSGSPTGNVTFAIRKVSDDSIIVSKVWGDASELSTFAGSYEEVTFDSPAIINEQVIICVEFSGGNSHNLVVVRDKNSDIKPSEFTCSYYGSSWFDYIVADLSYIYRYSVGWTETDWQNTLETNDTYYEDLTDLELGTEYEFQTQAKNSAGEGEWSASAYFETLTLEITNTPDNYGFGILAVGTNSSTTINYFQIHNTGGCAVDVTIQGTDLTGGDDTWDLADDATPGENIYGLYAGKDDADDLFDVIVRETATYNTLVSDLEEDATQDWGLEIIMPTSLSGYDAQVMTGTITLVASVS